ncbi:MAG: Methyltransferase FkbM [Pedosphaera sp.]|nr:Methyltransferase FkbM [Pedosphaera sp.]
MSTEGELVWEFFGRNPKGFFVEVGANDPQNSSQTWFLENKGWQGILVEPLSRFYTALCKARPQSRVFQVACGAPGHPPTAELFVGENSEHSSLRRNTVDAETRYVKAETVRLLTLDELLAEAGHPQLDFVSIDVEGMQLEVLKGFDLARHRPRLLFVEDHLLNWETHFHLKRQGYRLVKRTQLNNWYVPQGTPFRLTSLGERFKLWRKVWPGTPARQLKAWWRRGRL